MRRRVTSRMGIAGVGVIDGDTGFRDLMQGVSVVANEGANFAFEGLARVRESQAVSAARQATLPRNARGDLVSPPKTRDTAFPSLYSETYDVLLQKRFLNELGIQAAEKFADYHNRAQADPDQFRILADSYIEHVLDGVGDEAYETARAFLQNRASQHYTTIANQRAEIEYGNAVAYTEETLSRVVADGFNNAAMLDVDEQARADQDAQNRGLLEAELMLASQPDVNILTEAQANQIRDRYDVSVALGAAQRAARPIFMQATEPEDVDLLVAAATEQAGATLPAELETLLGGPEAAREAVQAVIKLAANEHKIQLAIRDMREVRLFENQQRRIQSTLRTAVATGDHEDFITAMLAMDPENFRLPVLRERANAFRTAAIGIGQDIERLDGTMAAQQIEIERWFNSSERRQLVAAADRIGVPLDSQGNVSFRPELLSNPEGLQTAVHLTNQLLSVLRAPPSGGPESVNEPSEHLALVNGITDDLFAHLGLDKFSTLIKAAEGDPEANQQVRQIESIVRQRITPHLWNKGHREDMDEGFVAQAIATHFGKPFDELAGEAGVSHAWQLAFQTDPGLAAKLVDDFKKVGGISQSAHEFIRHTGVDLAHGNRPIDDANVGAALALYGVLKDYPSAMHNSDLPDTVLQGFEQLWNAGLRGVYSGRGFGLDGGSAATATEVYRRQFGANENAQLAALGIKPDEGSQAAIRTALQERMQPGWLTQMWRPDLGYPPELEVRVQDYVTRVAPRTGQSVNEVIKDLARENFNQIGYGRSYITFTGYRSANDGAIVPEAPTLVLANGDMRRNPEPVEREVRAELAQRFSHIPGLAERPEQIYLTGVTWDAQGRHNSSTGLVSGQLMTAMAFLVDDEGNHIELTDERGFPMVLSVNDLYEAGAQRRISRIAADREAMRERIMERTR
jgi:hypothetical protein